MWVTVAVSPVASASCAALTVTVCAVFQSVEVKVRSAGSAVTSVLSVGSLIVTVTAALGSTLQHDRVAVRTAFRDAQRRIRDRDSGRDRHRSR